MLQKNCLHKSTSHKCYPVTKSDKDLLETFVDDMFGGPCIVFTRKAVVDKTLIRESYAKVLSELMLVSFILSICVKQCQLVCTQDEI